MKYRVTTAARLIQEGLSATGRGGYRAAMITPTYRPGSAWSASHISRLIGTMKEHYRRRGIGFHYVWVAEIQKKRRARTGASLAETLHYHIVIWLPRGERLPHPDTLGWWPHGMTNAEWARDGVNYCTAYARKLAGDPFVELPKGARLFGVGGLPTAAAVAEARFWMLPRWVRDRIGHDKTAAVKRARSGGGFVVQSSGELLRSGWGFTAVADHRVRLTEVERYVEAQPYAWRELSVALDERQAWLSAALELLRGLQGQDRDLYYQALKRGGMEPAWD